VIEVSSLSYRYATRQALRDVSFTLEPETITALVGPNGAGKSTLLRCMAALDNPFAGSVKLWGHDTHEHPRICHQLLGFLSDQFGLYDDLTIAQSLKYMAMAHHLQEYSWQPRVDLVSSQLGLSGRMHQKVGELSRGLRQRVAIAQAIMHQPKLLLLDEPASGLDPEARHELSNLLKLLRNEGMTIVVSSHILAELADYSTHMLVLREGVIRSHQALGNCTQTRTQQMHLSLSRAMPDAVTVLAAHAGIGDIHSDGLSLQFTFSGDIGDQSQLLAELIDAGLPIAEFAAVKSNLQDLYLADAGRLS
jgi:ABC-2 type transport system ATP-binding protein